LHPERYGRILKHLPEKTVLSTPNKIRAAALYLARTVQFESGKFSIEESRFCDEALNALRGLDNMNAGMLEESNGRRFRSDTGVLERAHIRIGQVVKHKTGGYRGICFGWTMDEATDTQTVSLLVDWYDYEEILHGQIPLKFRAEDFEVINEDHLLRIHHQDVSLYFSRFDVERGIYIPTADLLYEYPHDLDHLLATHEPTRTGSYIMAHADVATERISVFADYLAQTLADTLVSGGVLPAGVLDVDDPVLTHTGSRLEKRGEEVLQDVVTHLQGIRRTLREARIPPPSCEEEGGRDLSLDLDPVASLLAELVSKDCDESLSVSEEQRRLDVAHDLLSHIFSLFVAVEQLLVQRFQCVGGASHFLSLAPLAFPAKDGSMVLSDKGPEGTEIGDGTSSVGKARLPQDHLEPPILFRVGQIVRHRLFNYRGVVAGWDVRPSVDTSQWDGVKDSLLGREQPYYRVSACALYQISRCRHNCAIF
jgi:heat shock protein HspQ